MIKAILLALSGLLFAGCGAAATLPPTTAPSPTPDTAFIKTVRHRLSGDDTIPVPARQAEINLYQNRPTALFPDNGGLVLGYELLTTPHSQAEATRAAVLLMGTAVSVARDQGVPLSGVEVIFYAGDRTRPFIGFRVEPPWGAENILAVPLGTALLEAIEANDTAATVTPTPSATPPGRQSG